MTPRVADTLRRNMLSPAFLTDQAFHQSVADRSQAAALRHWRAEHQAAPGPLSPLARQTLFDLCRDDSDKGLRELRTVEAPVSPAPPDPTPPTKFPLIRSSLYSSSAPRSSSAPSQESGPKMRFFSRPGGFSNIRASLGLSLPDPAATNRSAPASPSSTTGHGFDHLRHRWMRAPLYDAGDGFFSARVLYFGALAFDFCTGTGWQQPGR